MCSNITRLIGELLKEQKCLEFFKFLLNLLSHAFSYFKFKTRGATSEQSRSIMSHKGIEFLPQTLIF